MIASSKERVLDDTDKAILRLLQTEGRLSNVELGQRVNLSPPAVHARIKQLEQRGYIRCYAALLGREQLGYDMVCFVNVRLQLHQLDHVKNFRETVLGMPEVLDCHHVTGNYDYLLKVVVQNHADMEDFVLHRLTPIPGIERIYTSVVLSEIKSTTMLPVK